MTKEQFIMELEQCLQGEVSAYELSDSLTYYRQYFEDEIRNGKSEEQVVEELGSPRLIARSIIDAHGIEESASGSSSYGDNSYESGYTQNDSSYRSYGDAYSDRGDIENNNQKGSLQSVGKMIMTIIISALVFFVVLFLLRALLPLAVIIIAAVLIVRLIRG
nr:DUF1700 domain-containing protein [uncultured Anaerobutyricum sp.]